MNNLEFKSFLAKVPKAELHVHIEAVVTIDTVKKLYKNRFGEEMSKEKEESIFTYDDLGGFLKSFLEIQDWYTSVQDFKLVFDDLANYLSDNGIVYCEAFFAPTAFLKKGFVYSEMISVFHEKITEIKNTRGITVKLLADVSRTFGLENAMNNYNLLKEFPCEDIIGIGLGGAEQKGPAKEFAPVYEQAIKDGFKVVAHAGEDVGPESIWDSINLLHSQRIGHGVTAIQDEKLIDHLAAEKIPVEICITSNTFTKKVVDKAENHPVRNFFDKGVITTINTDDPVFFKTTLLEEFYICHSKLNFNMDEIKALIINSFDASFLSPEEKQNWISKVSDAWTV